MSRRPVATTRGGARAGLIAVLSAVLATGGTTSCGRATDSDARADCTRTSSNGRVPTTGRPPAAHTGRSGAAGSTSMPAGSAPPPHAPSPAPSPPTPVNGRVTLTAVNSMQSVLVPAGTLIEVRLDPVSGSAWTLPDSSDPHALTRLSASGGCDGVAAATFRAEGEGQISATRPQGDAQVRFLVTIHVAG